MKAAADRLHLLKDPSVELMGETDIATAAKENLMTG
jgi:hypothetical protein